MKSYLILFLLFSGIYCLRDEPANILNCSKIDDDWSFQQYLQYAWRGIPLSNLDKYASLVACPLIVLLQLLFIVAMIKYRLVGQPPEDIFFALFVVNAFASLSLLANSVYHVLFSEEESMPGSFPAFCLTTGIVNIFTSLSERLYLIFFLVFMINNVKRSLKESKWVKGKFKHILSTVVILVIVFLAWLLEWIGLSQIGLCEITETRKSSVQPFVPVFEIGFALVFIVFSLYSHRYFKVHMPEVSALNSRKYQQNLLLTRFTIGVSFFEVLYSTTKFILYLNCERESALDLSVLASIINLTKILEFSFLIVVSFLDKKIGNKVKKLLKDGLSGRKMRNGTQRVETSKINEGDDLGLQQKWLDILQQDNKIDFLKVTQIMTMLTAVRTSYRQYLTLDEGLKGIKNLHFQEEVSFRVNSKWILQYEQEALILPRLSFLQSKFTIYSPMVFKYMLSHDKVRGIHGSFDLIQNREKLYQYGENLSGGRSGQFFFFTSDNQYILKTVPQEEFDCLLEELPLFYEHFLKFPLTLISKVFGMFKIQYTQIRRQYFVLLMKNIAGCKKSQIKRIFDMKGSTDDRQVIKDKNQFSSLSHLCPLKDVDFFNFEEKVHISQILSERVKGQLKEDTTFLKNLNIIDYSLLLMKIQWQQEPQNEYFWDKLNRIPSTKEENVFYHIALIDISQKWDRQKKGEKNWKKFLGKKDTSAQEPTFYQNRFLMFIEKIFGPSNKQQERNINDTLYSRKTSNFE